MALKAEMFQRTGAYKIRGALNKLRLLSDDQKRRGVICSSAGNHAQGVALAAAINGVRAVVVMAENATASKIEATRGYGAQVILHGTIWDEANEEALRLVAEQGLSYVHPFDDPVVIAGAGTVGLEIEEDAPEADVVIVGVGGGGLVSGIQTAVGAPRRVVLVEPELSTAFHTGVERGEPVPVTPTSIADGLSAPFAGRLALEICKDNERVLVSEDEIEHAFRMLYQRAKLAVEPAAAVAAAAWLAGKIEAENPVLVISGGNVAGQTAAAILARP